MNPLEGLPTAFCLTLDGEKDRQNETLRQFSKYGAKVQFFYGFDGRKTDYKKSPNIVTGEYFNDMSSGDIACCMGHIGMIRHWIKNSNEEVALFVEDDINLENCENWNFTWREMMDRLPSNWKAIQLALIRSDPISEVRFRTRVTADWCVTAYLLKRDYAVWLVDQYDRGNSLYLHTPGDPRAIPIVENAVYFPAEPHVYSFPIFTEKNTYASTFFGGQKKVKTHNDNSEKAVTSWWQNYGKEKKIDDFFSKTTMPPAIPMIGTAVVKNPKWLRRLIQSVDYPVQEFLVINNNGRGEIDAELDEIAKTGNPMIGKVRVLHMPMNLGVAASWNLMIKSYLKSPFWIIVNDDVAFCPGFLAEMHTETMRDPSAGLIHGYQGDHGIGSWDLFLIRDHVVQEYGLFDETLYPAYNEDADYFLRFMHKPLRRIMNLKSNYYHGDGLKDQYHTHGSQTGKSNDSLKEKLDRVNLMNFAYMEKKWGPGWRSCSVYQSPFNSNVPVSYTTFDIDFMRSKHLGF